MESTKSTQLSQDEDVDHNFEVLGYLSRGIVCLCAAEGQDVKPRWLSLLDPTRGPFEQLRFPWHQIPKNVSFSAVEWRTQAIADFTAVARLRPDEPWVWFQVGWNSFAYQEGPHNQEVARRALERVLELDPDNAAAHLALAWLLYSNGTDPESHDPKWREAAWAGPIGEHLRRGLARGGDNTAVIAGFIELSITKPSLDCTYLLTERSRSILFQAVDALDELVPRDYRFAYCRTCALLANEPRLELEWYEEALKWPTDDLESVFYTHRTLAKLTEPDPWTMLEHHLSAHKYMVQLVEHGDLDYDGDPTYYWLGDVERSLSKIIDRITPDMLPLVQEIADGGLDLIRREWAYVTDSHYSVSIGCMLATAARMLLDANDLVKASEYLKEALELEAKLEANWDREWDGKEKYFGIYDQNANDWRIVTARCCRDICINKDDWSGASRHNNHILELLPGDREARQAKPQIDSNARSERHHEEVTHHLNVLRSTTDALLTEVSIQRTATERLAQIRDEIETLTQRQALTPDKIDDVIEGLHDIVQQNILIQPLAVRKAAKRLNGELGEDVFSQLLPDSQQFLTTAEVFFTASEDIAPEIDAALISVEYAKVVETELRHRFLPALGRALDDKNFGGTIPIQPGSEIKRQGRMTWETRLSQLRLGQSPALLSQAARGPDTGIVLKAIGVPPLDREWLKHLADDLERVTLEYRNGAAHIEPAERAKVLEFRDLLFKGGLIKRLVELGKIGDRIAPVDRPRRGVEDRRIW